MADLRMNTGGKSIKLVMEMLGRIAEIDEAAQDGKTLKMNIPDSAVMAISGLLGKPLDKVIVQKSKKGVCGKVTLAQVIKELNK